MLKQTRANGQGNITPTGYIRIKVGGKLYLQHRYVWEAKYGKVPDGHDIHHIDGNKQNNSLDNLELLTRTEHKRKHSAWYTIDGKWFKPCKYCGLTLEVNSDNFFFTTRNNKNTEAGRLLFGKCKSCHIKEVDRARQIKKAQSRPFAYTA